MSNGEIGDRLFRQNATISKLILDGKRDPTQVSRLLQMIIDTQDLSRLRGEALLDFRTESEQMGLCTIDEQVDRLHAIWGPGFDCSEALKIARQMPLPKEAEGFALIPKPEAVARDYHDAVTTTRNALSHRHGGTIFWHRDRGSQQQYRERSPWQLGKATAHQLARWSALANGDVMCFPVQVGARDRRYYNTTADQSTALLRANEWPLGAYEVYALHLTHPEWVQGVEGPGNFLRTGLEGFISRTEKTVLRAVVVITGYIATFDPLEYGTERLQSNEGPVGFHYQLLTMRGKVGHHSEPNNCGGGTFGTVMTGFARPS